MSADAKVLLDEDGMWYGIHDGPCQAKGKRHPLNRSPYHLVETLTGIETCLGGSLVWQFRVYDKAEGRIGLVGYTAQ